MKLKLRIIPNAKKSEIVAWLDAQTLKIKIHAPPVEGKANEELIRFLAKTCGIKKSEIRILSGETGRDKLIEVPDGVDLLTFSGPQSRHHGSGS